VSMVPAVAAELIQDGYVINVETGAGVCAGFFDAAYQEAGCKILARDELICKSDAIFAIHPPKIDFDKMAGKILVAWVGRNQEDGKSIVTAANQGNITLIDVTAVPRIVAAQALDVLSSQAKVAGHRAVIEAAHAFGRFYAADCTAAGDSPPCRTCILGCGVAGLAAMQTSKALGSQVKAWDVRDMQNQVQTLGCEWVDFQSAPQNVLKDTDVAITTCAIPGRRSPLLITRAHVEAMAPGSVIVDLAATGGGNCELSRKGEAYTTKNGVTIIGYSDLPSRMAGQASLMYAQSMRNLLQHVHGNEKAAGLLQNMDIHLSSKADLETEVSVQITTDEESVVGSTLGGDQVFRFALADITTPIKVEDLQKKIGDTCGSTRVTVFAGAEKLAPTDVVSDWKSVTANCLKVTLTCITRSIVCCRDGVVLTPPPPQR